MKRVKMHENEKERVNRIVSLKHKQIDKMSSTRYDGIYPANVFSPSFIQKATTVGEGRKIYSTHDIFW